ncbi:MAG TPA: hypothetical protein PK479_07975 [Novosphingobium sp.]|nr:hypothetical protein [Novosphingobium sp.]HNN57159.1 hypothetical protein [Novosphingobium sp.]
MEQATDPRALWRLAAVAALPFLGIALSFGRIEGIAACNSSGDAILAFEMVRHPAEVAAQFMPGCRDQAIAAQTKGLWLDILGFVPVYSALLILTLGALMRESAQVRRLALAGIAAVVVAALADQWENSRLLAILAALPGDQATIDQLIPAVRTKFGLLGLAEVLIGALHLRQPGWRKLAGAAIAGGGLLSLTGLAINHELLMLGGTVAFVSIILAACVLALRRQAGA